MTTTTSLPLAGEIVLAPTNGFRRLAPEPSWRLPLAGVATLAAIVHLAFVPFTMAVVTRLAGDGNVTALATLERSLMGLAIARGGWVVLKAAFLCWVLWLTLSLKDEPADWRRLMTVVAYASLAFVAEDALRLAVFWLRGVEQIRGPQDLQSFTGLDAFVSTTNVGIVGRLMLAQISVFSLWFVALVRGGLVALLDVRPRSATVTAVLCWAYLLLLQLGVALVVASIQGRSAVPGL
jgi:hypothetical protein